MATTQDVAFRLSDLAADVDQRRGPRPASGVVKLAARRHFAVVAAELARLPLSLDQMQQFSNGLRGVVVRQPRTLWQTAAACGVEPRLVAFLHACTPGQQIALYDALERYWTLPMLPGETPAMHAERVGFRLR